MKTVTHDSLDTVNPSRLDKDKFYGVKTIGNYGFVTRANYNGGAFQVLLDDDLTNGNALCNPFSSLEDIFDHRAVEGMYEFETAQDLFQWFADNTKY